MTLTLDRVEVILIRICGPGLPTHQIELKSEKLFEDGQTHLSSVSQLAHPLAMT